jgi:non-ribosomal peptide synthetase component E (peptide arylation enzyme)
MVKVRTEMVKVTALVPLLALLWVPDFQSWQSDTASIGSSDGGADRSIDIFALFVRTRS